jgi:integrase
VSLTVKQVERIREPGRHFDENGLYLQVTGKGAKSWLLRYARDGRERWMGLGSCRNFSLAEARERARRARQQLSDGVDPIDAKRARRAAEATERAKQRAATKTFAEITRDYHLFHSRTWTNAKHRRQFISSLECYAYPVIGRVPVADVDKTMIIAILRPMWEKNLQSTGARVRGRIERVLDYAKVNGYRAGDNPATWNKNLEHALPKVGKVQHHSALPYPEVHDFVTRLRATAGAVSRALEFTILTAARTEEVRGATWSEIDMEKRVWKIPAARMKADREHCVPLADRCVEILRAQPRDRDHVFVGALTGAAMGINSMSAVLRKLRPGVTVHGFRSTFRDWAADLSSAPHDVVEMALAHAVGSETVKAYKRTDLLARRAKLMAAWAQYVAAEPDADNVTQLRREAAG